MNDVININELEKKKWLIVVFIILLLLSIAGATYAYWGWTTNELQKTNVVVTIPEMCIVSADGGGSVNSTSISMVPTTCTNTNHAIIKEIDMDIMFGGSDMPTNIKLWLNVDSISPELTQTTHFKYALSTSPTNCSSSSIIIGSFSGVSIGDKVTILDEEYSGDLNETINDKLYLYIWLDSAETNVATAGKSFKFTLNGDCTIQNGESEAYYVFREDTGALSIYNRIVEPVSYQTENDVNINTLANTSLDNNIRLLEDTETGDYIDLETAIFT